MLKYYLKERIGQEVLLVLIHSVEAGYVGDEDEEEKDGQTRPCNLQLIR